MCDICKIFQCLQWYISIERSPWKSLRATLQGDGEVCVDMYLWDPHISICSCNLEKFWWTLYIPKKIDSHEAALSGRSKHQQRTGGSGSLDKYQWDSIKWNEYAALKSDEGGSWKVGSHQIIWLSNFHNPSLRYHEFNWRTPWALEKGERRYWYIPWGET